MRMTGCVSPPTPGELTIFGADPVRDGAAIRARLGVVPQEDTFDVELTVRENLLDFVQLADRGGHKVEALPGGMKRLLTITGSLINDPDILRRSSRSASCRGDYPLSVYSR
jgi:lipooligosaccharide transport system ATP-binding protein